MDQEGCFPPNAVSLVEPWKLTIPTSSLTAATRTQQPRRRDDDNDDDNDASSHNHINHLDQVAAIHGMPWKSSIDPTYEQERIHKDHYSSSPSSSSLFYMPFWEWQLQFMKENLTNLRVLPVTSAQTDNDLSFVQNVDRKMRLHTLMAASDEYKCIRMTVLDAGPKCQVFTSLWYPNPAVTKDEFLPLLGVDLLQLQNQKKHLCIVDFQPISVNNNNEDSYETSLKNIRDQYPSLQGKMTDRFYDETSFFSKHMLLGRCNNNNNNNNSHNDALQMVFDDLFPAYQSCVQQHVQMVQKAAAATQNYHDGHNNRMALLLERYAAYDTYSAERDPAHGLLAGAFGKDFADDYVYNILFPLSLSLSLSEQPPKHQKLSKTHKNEEKPRILY